MVAQRTTGGVLLTALFVMALIGQASATSDPPWVGRWGSPNCASNATRIGLAQDKLDFSTFDATCAVQAVEKAGDVTVIKAQCADEEGSHPIALSLRVSGKTLTFIQQTGFEFDPKSYVRCR